MNFLRKISNDRLTRIVFEEIGEREGYLVGGFIRDAAMGKKGKDRDYVVRGRLASLVGRIAVRTGGTYFSLGKLGLLRIVLPDGSTMDFSPLRCSLGEDLRNRDFSINAMAWAPRCGLVDIFGGCRDIAGKMVRSVLRDSVSADPVRIVRAFRFSQLLGFTIEEETLSVIRLQVKLIEKVASERITGEFFVILNAEDPFETLGIMLRSKLIQRLIFLNNKELLRKIKVISNFGRMVKVLPVKYHFTFGRPFSQGLTRLGMLRLEVLLGGGVEHRLCLSKAIRERLSLLDNVAGIRLGRTSLPKLFDLFEYTGEAAEDLLLLRGGVHMMPAYFMFLRAGLRPILSAAEIKQAAHLQDGPLLGKAIRRLRRAQFLGLVRSKRQALNMMRDSGG